MTRWRLVVALGLVLMTVLGIRWRLASIPLERDEGEYACIARLMLQGIPPFREAYTMKFPGTPLVYASIFKIFEPSDIGIRYGLIFWNAWATVAMYRLGAGLVSRRVGAWIATVYVVASASVQAMGLSANAEHFVLAPALWGLGWLVVKVGEVPSWKRCFGAGVFLGMAGIMKQQGFSFSLLAAGVVLLGPGMTAWCANGRQTLQLVSMRIWALAMGIGMPLLGMILWMQGEGVYRLFEFWTLEYARSYTRIITWRQGVHHFAGRFLPIFFEQATLWFAAAIGIVFSWKRDRRLFGWMIGLGMAGLFALSAGLFFRAHYFLFWMPFLALGAGYALGTSRKALFVAWLALVFPLWVQRDLYFCQTPERVCRNIYPNNPFVEAREVGRWLRGVTQPGEKVGILGSEPEISFYADRPLVGRFLYLYPMFEPQPYAVRMQREMIQSLETEKPRYLVHVRFPSSWGMYPDSKRDFIEWMPSFLKMYYKRDRVVECRDMFGEVRPWELVIYQRKT